MECHCTSKLKGFFSIEDARAYMKIEAPTGHKEVIKAGAGETNPEWESEAFYAVAHGRKPGIFPYW